MIAVIDYGAGNLGSVQKALRFVGAECCVTHERAVVAAADAVVLPGVGAFSACMNGLAAIGMVGPVREFIASGRPFLGICVGLQMLFDYGEEMGVHPGLGVLGGKVVRFNFGESAEGERPLKVPHIGWNSLEFPGPSRLFQGISEGERVYFVHSFYPEPKDASIVSATSCYGYPFCAAIERDNLFATQFHPEKSGTVGLQILRNFTALIA